MSKIHTDGIQTNGIMHYIDRIAQAERIPIHEFEDLVEKINRPTSFELVKPLDLNDLPTTIASFQRYYQAIQRRCSSALKSIAVTCERIGLSEYCDPSKPPEVRSFNDYANSLQMDTSFLNEDQREVICLVLETNCILRVLLRACKSLESLKDYRDISCKQHEDFLNMLDDLSKQIRSLEDMRTVAYDSDGSSDYTQTSFDNDELNTWMESFQTGIETTKTKIRKSADAFALPS